MTAYPVGHPDAERFGTELLVQARSGAMDEQEGLRPGPIAIRMPFASWGAAYLLAGGIGVQLFVRERHDVAEPIHTSLLQGSLVPAALYWQRAELPPEWMRAHTLPKRDAPPHLSIFRCADGRWLQVIGAFTKSPPMVAFLKEIGRVDLAGVRCLPGNQFEWAAVFAHRTLDEWTRELWAVDVPCMPVLDLGEVLATEQARLNGYAVEVNDPVFGATLQAGHPIEADPSAVVRCGAPEVGAFASLPSAWRQPRPTAVTSEAATGTADPTRPLSGVRVVDFGAYVAGPLGAQCLADFGAEVIKVEPIGGEKGRTLNQFTACQRGKRSLAIDLRHPLVAPVRERLLQWADIVTHNMRSSAAAKLGVDESAIRAANPRAIIALSSGYGERGKWAPLPAFDPTGLA